MRSKPSGGSRPVRPRTTGPDIHITPIIQDTGGLGELFNVETSTFVLKSGQNSAIGQMILTPIPNDWDAEDLLITIGAQGFGGQAHIRLLDDRQAHHRD